MHRLALIVGPLRHVLYPAISRAGSVLRCSSPSNPFTSSSSTPPSHLPIHPLSSAPHFLPPPLLPLFLSSSSPPRPLLHPTTSPPPHGVQIEGSVENDAHLRPVERKRP